MRILLGFCLGALLFSCNSDPRAKLPATGSFGKEFTPSESVADANSLVLSDSSANQIQEIQGEIVSYCKGEGCWITLKYQDSLKLRVNTKDKSFILPRNLEGKMAVAKGSFVAKPNNQPAFSFEADGIIIK